MRIFAASLATETNTFSPIPTGFANFVSGGYYPPGKHPDEPKLCTAPLYVARKRAKAENFTLIEGSCFWAEPSGTCTKAAYERMRDEILDQLRAAMPVDAVLMGFHGAFVAEGYDDVEGDVLERIRAMTGDKVVIGCEYDPHCHLTAKRVRLADISILFKEYPHSDFVERGEEVVDLVLRTLRGQITPQCSLYDPRMYDFYPTTVQPMRAFVDKVSALEGRDGVLSISIGHGFSHADVPDMGSRVLVITDNRKTDGDALAKALAAELVAKRGAWSPPTLDLDDMLTAAMAHNGGTVVLAEPSDNAGGGAASDNTLSIRRMLERGMSDVAVGPVWDPVAVAFCHAAGAGATIDLRFGGKASAGSGDPIDATVEVLAIKTDAWQSFGRARVDLGDTAAIRVGGLDIVLISKRTQALGREFFEDLGIDPAKKRLVVVKSAQHFAGAFGPIASLILRAETGGCCPQDPRNHHYDKVRRPLWPLDEDFGAGSLLV